MRDILQSCLPIFQKLGYTLPSWYSFHIKGIHNKLWNYQRIVIPISPSRTEMGMVVWGEFFIVIGLRMSRPIGWGKETKTVIQWNWKLFSFIWFFPLWNYLHTGGGTFSYILIFFFELRLPPFNLEKLANSSLNAAVHKSVKLCIWYPFPGDFFPSLDQPDYYLKWEENLLRRLRDGWYESGWNWGRQFQWH